MTAWGQPLTPEQTREYVKNLVLQWHCVKGAPSILNPLMLKVVHRGSSWAVGTWE